MAACMMCDDALYPVWLGAVKRDGQVYSCGRDAENDRSWVEFIWISSRLGGSDTSVSLQHTSIEHSCSSTDGTEASSSATVYRGLTLNGASAHEGPFGAMNLLAREEPAQCLFCNCALTVIHILLECQRYNSVRQRYFSVITLKELFDTIESRDISFLYER